MRGEDRTMELLDGEAAQRYISQHLRSMEENDKCVIFLIDIDNTAEIVEHYGEKEKECVTQHMGHMLSSVFRASDIVSQVGNDEFIVFLSGDFTEEEIVRQAEALCESVQYRPEEAPKIRVTACIGVYIAYGRRISFERLFGQAAAALYKAKKSGRGSFYILTNRKELRIQTGGSEEDISGISVNTLMEYMDSGIGLLEIGTEIRLIYASHGLYQMLGRDRDSLPVPCGIREIGIHPDYEADYEEALREGAKKEGATDHIHRICVDGDKWVWRHVRAARVAYPGRENPVMLELSTDISELIRTERQLRVSNERLRVAFRQTPHVLWEVDIGGRTFNIYNVDEQKCQQDTVVTDFPRSFLERRIVHPDSAEDFRKFAEEMISGRTAGKGNFMMRDSASHSYGWVSMSYRMTYDEEGRPLKAVGVQAKLPGLAGIGSSVMRRRPLPEIVRRHLLIRTKVNLTKDAVEEIWLGGIDQTAWTWGKTYSQILEVEKRYLFARKDERSFQERFLREKLIREYENGVLWSAEEYRNVDEAGHIGWLRAVVNLVRNVNTGDVHMYACYLDSQLCHDREKLAGDGIMRDPVTGLYDMKTVREIAKALIENSRGTKCALSLIRIMGDERSDRLRRFMAVALTMALGMDCVVGQYSPEIILAFIPDSSSRFDVKHRIEDAFAYLRVAMADIPEINDLRFVAGTVTSQTDEADYDSMLLRAGFLSEQGKYMAVDTVFFPTEDEEWTWAGLYRAEGERSIPVDEGELERPLSEGEQAEAFRCVADMLSARSLESSLSDVLRDLGRFYDADRTYILKLSTDRQAVDMVWEWTAPAKQSIRSVVQGARMSRIPLLRSCCSRKAPVTTDCRRVTSDRGDGPERWHFITYPLQRSEEISGFLCIENAQRHMEDMALLRTLAPYISGEEDRFHNMADSVQREKQDALTRLPNLSSYMEAVCSMDSGSYSSMGVLALDIPNYSSINSSYGFEYGKKMLVYIAETLANVFGKTSIFRTWDAEFVVLFPNTIQEVFNGRCARLRTIIQRRYPRQVRIGCVWAEGVFSARHMVKEAQSIMHNENVKEPVTERGGALEGLRHKAEVSQKDFVPYFQPKVDMRDGSLTGAEALVRRIGINGSILLPDGFIEKMEQDGTIRKLDLLMLELVLRQLSEWRDKGYPPIRVSINISRVTLFHSTTFASVLAIQSRYPEVPAEQIELEITETAGDIEKATLAEIIERFRQCGIRFELDDFGSGYANLSLLSNVRFHTVKLDRTLVNDIPDNEISSMMAENITQICRNFGMKCIAEGVETQRQAEALLRAGCVYGQGYYYAKPMPARMFEKKYFDA